MVHRLARHLWTHVHRTEATQRLEERALPLPSRLTESIRRALNPSRSFQPDRSVLATTGLAIEELGARSDSVLPTASHDALGWSEGSSKAEELAKAEELPPLHTDLSEELTGPLTA